jgi:hypothetical protein
MQLACPTSRQEARQQPQERPRPPALQRDHLDGEQELQTQAAEPEGSPVLAQQAESYLNQSQGGGEPLSDADRAYMEPRFGRDFGAVRVHTDAQAAGGARAIHAQAFTRGQDIYFGAGSYARGTPTGRRLLAHELAHTVQQGTDSQDDSPSPLSLDNTGPEGAGGVASRGSSSPPDLQRWPDFLDEAASAAWDTVSDVGEAAYDVATDVGAAASDIATDVGEAAYEVATDVGEAVYEAGAAAVEVASDVASEAGDWLATRAGQLARSIADAVGGILSITRDGLEIRLPRLCPIEEGLKFPFDLGTFSKAYMVPVYELPIGPDLFLSASIGLAGHVNPRIRLQLGPVCLDGARILVNPLTGTFRASGSLSATVAAALAVEARGGLRGEGSLEAIVPIATIPVPISVPVIGLEGGVAGILQGIGATTFTVGGSISTGGSVIDLSQDRQLDVGLGADLFLGAYAQLDLLGEKVCRIYWQPYEWHGDIAASLGLSFRITIVPGLLPIIVPRVDPPTIERIPFDDIPLILSRKGFQDECPFIDKLCKILEQFNLLPSQRGGVWEWTGEYGPGQRLAGPLEVYETNPHRASGALCRGACGPDCETCQVYPFYHHTDPVTGQVWEYTNFYICGTHEGCRQHDAAFDWAADKKGEKGDWAIVMPWHMAANVECACHYPAGNCIAWIAGLPPHDDQMHFADSAEPISSGYASHECKQEHRDAIDCTEEGADRDVLLARWGSENGILMLDDCRGVECLPPGSVPACEGAAAEAWHCTAIDLGTLKTLTISVYACECCREDGTPSSEWREPHVVVVGNMSTELVLALCEAGYLPRAICIPIEEEMIRRFGNRRRDLGFDPDAPLEQRLRLDDAPVYASFRRMYNRLDSWNIFVRTRHPDWHAEFAAEFQVERRRVEWINEIKAQTKAYKERFRNLATYDTDRMQQDYEREVVGNVQKQIQTLNEKIAIWYRTKTGTSETIAEIIERVHREGTEMWREAWRTAILQVNRVLARLWPPARTRIIAWVEEKRAQYPQHDLAGHVGQLDYIGSLATGYKGPPKQAIRFNPDKFDVDANLEAPPLAKYAIAIDHLVPDRERIFASRTSIEPLKAFSAQTHGELSDRVRGYDTSEPFDVVIQAWDLPTQLRQRVATEDVYILRGRLDEATYSRMLTELEDANLVERTPEGTQVRADLTEREFDQAMEIIERYTP